MNQLRELQLKVQETNDLDERNRLSDEWRELRRNTDYGFKVGDRVEYCKGKRDWKEGKILSISDRWQIEFHDAILPVECVRAKE